MLPEQRALPLQHENTACLMGNCRPVTLTCECPALRMGCDGLTQLHSFSPDCCPFIPHYSCLFWGICFGWVGEYVFFFTIFFFLVISDQSSYSSCRPNSKIDVQDSVRWTSYTFLITCLQPQADMQTTLIIHLGQSQASVKVENLSLTGIFLHASLKLFFLFTLYFSKPLRWWITPRYEWYHSYP